LWDAVSVGRGFYLSRGCRLADPVHPVLFQHEPDDIRLVGQLG
jgi:hypothetical protein